MTEAFPADSVTRHRLILVGGLHRSGTTPLARLLGAHPQVSAFHDTGVKEDEGQHLQDVYPAARTYGGAGRFAQAPEAHLTETSPLATPDNARRMFASWSKHWDLSRPVLVEKSPPNLVMSRFLQQLFPDARFLMIVRHPAVVAMSTSKWAGPGTSIADLVEHWLVAHETFLGDAGRLRAVRVVKYERLLAEPEETLEDLAAYLELDEPLSADSLEQGRSARYQEEWNAMLSGGNPWRRRQVRAAVERYAERVARFGYNLEDLSQVGAFPDLASGFAAGN
jgi:hypothetical protein